MVILNKVILPLPVDFSILDDKAFNAGIFGQHPSKQLYLCKLIEGLPVGLFLDVLEVPEVLSPILEGVVVFVLLH